MLPNTYFSYSKSFVLQTCEEFFSKMRELDIRWANTIALLTYQIKKGKIHKKILCIAIY